MGDFTVGLYGNDGPITVGNFLTYVDEAFYDGLIFHRVIADFVVQGGGHNPDMSMPTTHAPIDLEIIDWLHHTPGVISMARTSNPNSATSQFFICVETLPSLDGEYAAFGEVIDGYEVVEAMSLVETDVNDKPVVDIVMESVTVQ
jgi:peptidyl-prolyl cis-trans isomerase B (cyclophilin B)